MAEQLLTLSHRTHCDGADHVAPIGEEPGADFEYHGKSLDPSAVAEQCMCGHVPYYTCPDYRGVHNLTEACRTNQHGACDRRAEVDYTGEVKDEACPCGCHSVPVSRSVTTSLADALIDLARLALAFGRIDRTTVYHPDGVTPESDTDHTVMLGWVACAIAARFFPQLDLGLVAQFALIHDAPEVYAGDTPSLRIDDAGRKAKAKRERAAISRLASEFGRRLPWFPFAIARYEQQQLPEARFVRGVDKVLPRLVHLLDGGVGLREFGVDRDEWVTLAEQTRASLAEYAGEFTELMSVREVLGERILAGLDHDGCASDHA
jgi:putative hydrolase of HD superfamily